MAHNVVAVGYRYSHAYLKIVPTEFLKLLTAYLGQARELQALAGSDGFLRVNTCEEAAPLLKVLGHRVRRDGCDAGLEVDDPERAFLTSDSAFPLVQLEE